MKKTINKLPRQLVLIVLFLSLTSCNMPGSSSEIAYPTAAVVEIGGASSPTTQQSAQEPQEPAQSSSLPTIKFTSSQTKKKEVVLGDKVEIEFSAKSTLGIPFVEMTLNSINGQSLASFGTPDAQQGEASLRQTLTWEPEKAGEYILYLTAYDTQKKASTPATLTVIVYPRPKVITSGIINLENGEGYDFVAEKKGSLLDGDLYATENGGVGPFICSDYSYQSDGQFLFDWRNVYPNEDYTVGDVARAIFDPKIIKMVFSEDTQKKFKRDCMLINEEDWGFYLYKRNESPNKYILFYGIIGMWDSKPSQTLLDYVVFEAIE